MDNELSEKDREYNQLIEDITKPVFNYYLKRIKVKILENESHKDIPMNLFYNLLVASSALFLTNLLRWIEGFHKIKTNEEINFKALEESFYHHLTENLKIIQR